MKKYKVIVPVVLLALAFLAKFILWDFAISNGKRTGNLVKVSKKGKVLKTWEGTLDLGSGDLLTFDFSVEDEQLAKELYQYTGNAVSIFYEEHLLGWPRETHYSVVEWIPKGGSIETSGAASTSSEEEEKWAAILLNKTLFCSVVGSLYQDQKLYLDVKNHLKENNLYLYRQIETCNQ